MMKVTQGFVVGAIALALCGCVSAQGVSSNNPQYNYVGELAPSGTFKNEYFQFSYSPPAYVTSGWEHYEGKNGKRATTLLKGSGLYNSYAVDIEYKGTVAQQITPVEAARTIKRRKFWLISFLIPSKSLSDTLLRQHDPGRGYEG